MKKFALAALALAGSLSATQSFAVIDAQVMGGARTAKVDYTVGNEDKTKDVKSTEIGFAAHLSPSKLLPVSFGVFAAMNKYDTTAIVQEQIDADPTVSDEFSEPSSSISGMTYGPELMAWVPIPMFKPYLRASYVMGNYDWTNKADVTFSGFDGSVEQTITYKTTGYDVGVGFMYSPVPLLGLVVEYNIGAEKLTATKGKATTKMGSQSDEQDIKADDLDPDDKSKDFGSSAIRLGLSLSL